MIEGIDFLLTGWKGQHYGINFFFDLLSEKWRFIQYVNDSEELYDHDRDPYEWSNLVNNPKYKQVKAELRKWVPKQGEPLALVVKVVS